MSRDHTFVHSTFLQTATGKGIAGEYLFYVMDDKDMTDVTIRTL